MKWWVETVEGGSRALELGEMIGGLGRKPTLKPMYQSASVALLLKIIYQHVSGSDVMDIVQFD